MAVCHHYRIPHSVFLGRTVEPGDPMWLDDDRAKALAYHRHLSHESGGRCPSCRTEASDWVDLESGRRLVTPAWTAETYVCHGCREIDRVSQDIPDDERSYRHVRLAPADAASRPTGPAGRTVTP